MKLFWGAEISLGGCILDYLPEKQYRNQVKNAYSRILKGENHRSIDHFSSKKGQDNYFENFGHPIPDKNGTVTGIMFYSVDISERVYAEEKLKRSLSEKEILLKEIHHRVKNNLQIITSMINLQLKMVKDESVKRTLQDSLNRINTMGQLHRSLYQGESLAEVRMGEYLDSLLDSIRDMFGTRGKEVKIETHFEDISLDPDKAIPVGLIVNELVTNSYKHAFEDRPQGSIFVSLSASDSEGFHLSVRDDGSGILEKINAKDPDSLGTRLVSVFVTQLKGRLENTSAGGLTVDVFF
jgi:two-component sensor histidine kinase